MKLTFLGANHEVTGSCTLLEAAGQRYLIDCGMEQGKDTYESQPIPVAPGEIDGVLATHAHIDHTGLLPLLARNGFRGRIYATNPTVELCGIMLRDSAHIQEFEAEWKNRKGKRSGAEPVEPMYTVQDAEAAIKLFRGVDYNTKLELAPGLVIEFVDVGHLLGSASIAIWVTENGTTTKLVFSGDIGNQNQPLIKDPTYLTDADYVVMESTYGDRLHGPRPDYIGELARILQRTFDRGGNVVIPSFAVGRTQELLYFIREIKEKGLVKGHGNFPVYIDSPLAIEATRIFRDTDPDCFDEATRALLAQGIDPIQCPGLRVSVTSDESRMINADREPKVILSGMCEAGRIRHHLKHNLWRPECTILFVGYQAVGTLGRTLIEGATDVKLFGEAIEVRAEICQLTGLSGHADKNGLLAWIPSPSGSSSSTATTRWRTSSPRPSPTKASRPVRPTMGRSGSSGPRGPSACRRAPESGSSVGPVRVPAAPPRFSSAWSAQASACCGSSSTTRAEPTKTLPGLLTRSTPSATSGTDKKNSKSHAKAWLLSYVEGR